MAMNQVPGTKIAVGYADTGTPAGHGNVRCHGTNTSSNLTSWLPVPARPMGSHVSSIVASLTGARAATIRGGPPSVSGDSRTMPPTNVAALHPDSNPQLPVMRMPSARRAPGA